MRDSQIQKIDPDADANANARATPHANANVDASRSTGVGFSASATELEAHRQLQSQFLSTISHELRTPLTALAGYGELLADGILGTLSPSQHDTVERMRAVTNQLTVMIDSILTFTSLQAGSEKPVLSQVNPTSVLREAAAIMEPIARKKGMEFAIHVEEVETLYSDKEKIRQILVHLLDNAIKFTTNPETSQVRLSVSGDAREVRFSVTDTGIGISPEDISQLFLPFIQVHTGLTRRHGGIGLGLYIAQSLAALLGGRVQVESTLGAGSTFSLHLPRGLA